MFWKEVENDLSGTRVFVVLRACLDVDADLCLFGLYFWFAWVTVACDFGRGFAVCSPFSVWLADRSDGGFHLLIFGIIWIKKSLDLLFDSLLLLQIMVMFGCSPTRAFSGWIYCSGFRENLEPVVWLVGVRWCRVIVYAPYIGLQLSIM